MFMAGSPQTRAAETEAAPQVVRQRRFTPVRPSRATSGEDGEDGEAGGVAAGQLLGGAEAGGEVEAADAAGHADQAGHDADLAAEALRHELEHGAVAHAERQHGDDEDERAPSRLAAGPCAIDEQRERGDGVHGG